MTPLINWTRLSAAVEYYAARGYVQREVEWVVGQEEDAATRPATSCPLTVRHGENDWVQYLVGSGEQSFVQAMKEGSLPGGRSFCVTPCFRDEARYDELHLPRFMKLELIDHDPPAWDLSIRRMMQDATRFLEQYVSRDFISWVYIGTGMWDIEVNGIEVGSYGYRHHRLGRWVYGTGLAEPRASQAIAKGW